MLYVLKYLSWTLNVNINLFTICEKKNTLHKNKYILQYIFQNTLLKILRQPLNFNSLNIIHFENNYYILNTPNIFPTLIDLPTSTSITFNNVNITLYHILDILNKNCSRTFPFNIKIFSSYCFLRHNSKQLGTNMIGQYTNPNNPTSSQEILYIFVTPHLERHSFYIHQLINVNTPNFHPSNPFTLPLHHEGLFTKLKKNNLPKLTNQKVCICQHENTQEMHLPKRFNNLGKEINKYT